MCARDHLPEIKRNGSTLTYEMLPYFHHCMSFRIASA